jgi:hypothetical protein
MNHHISTVVRTKTIHYQTDDTVLYEVYAVVSQELVNLSVIFGPFVNLSAIFGPFVILAEMLGPFVSDIWTIC